MSIEQLDLYNQLCRSVSQSLTCFTVLVFFFLFVRCWLWCWSCLLSLLVMSMMLLLLLPLSLFWIIRFFSCLVLCRNILCFFLVYDLNANCHCCQILIEGDLRWWLPTTTCIYLFAKYYFRRYCYQAILRCCFCLCFCFGFFVVVVPSNKYTE